MLHSKIPVRAPSKLPVRSDRKNEVGSAITQQKGKTGIKRATSETKHSYEISKDQKGNSNPVLQKAQNKNLQHKLLEKNLKQGRKEISQFSLKERNENKKPLHKKEEKPNVVKGNYASSLKPGNRKTLVSTNTYQTNRNLNPKARDQKKNQNSKLTKNLESKENLDLDKKDQHKVQSQKPKAVTESNPVSSLNIGSKKPLDCINIQRCRNIASRDQKKVLGPNFTTNHPLQPDIEFVIDENSRKRILSGKELSPGILKMPPRMQSSIYRKFSLYKPIAAPLNPKQAVLKFLENRECGKRLSVKKADYQVSPFSYRYSISHKTPKEAVQDALRRLSEIRLKEKLKSTKKVTFKLQHSGEKPTTSAVEENRQLLESKPKSCQRQLTYTSNKCNLGSQQSMPELDVNLALNSNIPFDGLQPTVSDGKKMTITSFENEARIRHQGNAFDFPNTRKTDKIHSGILKTNKIIADDMERRGSLFCSKVFNHRKLRRSLSASELSTTPSLEKIHHLDSIPNLPNIRRTSKMPSSILKAKNYVAAIDGIERRGSLLGSRLFAPGLPNTRKKPSGVLNADAIIAAMDDAERRGSLFCSKAYNPIKLKSLSTSEVSRTPSLEEIRYPYSSLNLPNLRKMPSSVLEANNKAAAIDDAERRGSLFCSKVLRPRMLRRSLSASELKRTPRSTLAQPQPSDAKLCIDTENDGEAESCSFPFLTFRGLRTSVSSPELREITEARLENSESPMSSNFCRGNQLETISQMQNPLLYSQNKNHKIRPSNGLMNSVNAAELRGSLYLPADKNAIPANSQAPSKLCTPCPVSFYKKPREADSFSPEFLCRRTSNILSHAPIKTPLVMRNLAENEQINYNLSPVCQKLDFGAQKEKDSRRITQAYLQTFKTYQVIMDSLADQECCVISSSMCSPSIYIRSLPNPIAKTLIHGDEMHFVPVKLL